MHLKIRGQNNRKPNPCPSQCLPLDIALSIIPSPSSFFDLLSSGFSLRLNSYLPKEKRKNSFFFDPVSPLNISVDLLIQTFRKENLYSLPSFSFPLIPPTCCQLAVPPSPCNYSYNFSGLLIAK